MTEHFLSTTGNDGNTGTVASPWRSWEHALSQLQPGDTLTVRGGRYYERGITFDLQGSSSDPITIRAYPGEKPVVDGSYEQLQVPDQNNWVLYDGPTNTWKTVASFADRADKLSAIWEEDNGERTRLNRYKDLNRLMETNEEWDSSGNYYAGPGFFQSNDGHIYIRLQPSDPTKIYGVTEDAPSTLNPNELAIHVSPGEYRVFADQNIISHHVVFDGIDFLLGGPVLDTQTAHDITFKNSNFTPPNFGQYSFILRGDAHDFHFEGSEVYGEVGQWVAWNDVKNGPSGGQVARSMRVGFLAVTDDENVHGISFKDGKAQDLFDFFQITTNNPVHDIQILNNRLAVRDDAMQIDGKNYDWEFAYNYADYTGPGHHGANQAAPVPGTKYVHHNVIDASVQQLWGRLGTEAAINESEGLTGHMAFNRHSSNAPDAWKIYNNTIVLAQPGEDQGAGEQRTGAVGDEPHEFYNNIVVMTEDWYLSRGRKEPDLDNYDNNMYWRTSQTDTQPLFYKVGTDERHYDDLAALQQGFPRWEQNSIEADPKFLSLEKRDLTLAADSPALTMAKDLSGFGWPGTEDSEPYIGAVQPAGDIDLNASPVAADDSAVTDEGVAVAIDVRANDTDPDGDPLVVESVGNGADGTTSVNPDGTVTYTPDLGFAGTDRFSYTVADGNGGRDTAAVAVTVNATGDGDGSDPGPDAPAEALAFLLDPVTGNTVPDNVAINTAASYSAKTVAVAFETGNDISGPQMIFEQGGATRGLGMFVDDGRLFIAVWNTREENWGYKELAADIAPGTRYTATLVMDGALPDDGTLTGFINGVQVGQTGGVGLLYQHGADVGIGWVKQDTMLHGAGFFGNGLEFAGTVRKVAEYNQALTGSTLDQLQDYMASGWLGTDGPAPSNSAPVALDDTAETDANTAVAIDVKANDTDADGDALSVTDATDGSNGVTVLNPDGTVTYTPSSGFSGSDSFTYVIGDGKGGSDSATVTVEVQPVLPVNTAPDARNDVATTDENSVVTIDVLANDDDVDGDPLNVTGVGAAAHGAAILNSNGTISYTPAADYSGSDSFTYSVSDGNGGTDSAQVEVEIRALGGLPTISGTGGADRIFGTDDAEEIHAGAGDDRVDAGAGDDVLFGEGGIDTLYGEEGDDKLDGGDGDDKILNGGSGDDTVDGGDGNDRLWGHTGNDLLVGGPGNDRIDGDSGIDTVSYEGSPSGVMVDLDDDMAEDGHGGADTVVDSENVLGSAFADSIVGDHNDNVLSGNAGDDTIDGGKGDDILHGGAGSDTLVGGPGSDRFRFTADSAFDAADRLADFDSGSGDVLDLAGLLEGYDPAADVITDYIATAEEGNDTVLAVDRDGAANGADFHVIARLTGVLGLDVAAMVADGQAIV